MSHREIEITWEGPHKYDEVCAEYNLDNEVRCDSGLYQIYGRHDLYSNKKRPEAKIVLLYVGKTVKRSKFAGRIKKQGFCCYDKYHEIYLGRIDIDKKNSEEDWEKDVSDAEKLIINKYAPPYNSHHCGDLCPNQLHNENILIINRNMRMDLDEKIDSNNVVYRPKE